MEEEVAYRIEHSQRGGGGLAKAAKAAEAAEAAEAAAAEAVEAAKTMVAAHTATTTGVRILSRAGHPANAIPGPNITIAAQSETTQAAKASSSSSSSSSSGGGTTFTATATSTAAAAAAAASCCRSARVDEREGRQVREERGHLVEEEALLLRVGGRVAHGLEERKEEAHAQLGPVWQLAAASALLSPLPGAACWCFL